MVDHISEKRLLHILMEVKSIAENDIQLTSQDVVKEIHKLLLEKNEVNEKQAIITT